MQGLFPGFTIVNLEETLLGGNQYKSDSNRFSWNVSSMDNSAKDCVIDDGGFEEEIAYSAIQLKPMEIRTFMMELRRI